MFEFLDDKFQAWLKKRASAVARQLVNLTGPRRAKFQNTIYHLEPDLKDSPGGLRDLQTIRWLNTLRGHQTDLGASFDVLRPRCGFVCMKWPGGIRMC